MKQNSGVNILLLVWQPSMMFLKILKKWEYTCHLVIFKGMDFYTLEIVISVLKLLCLLFETSLMFVMLATTYMLTTSKFQLFLSLEHRVLFLQLHFTHFLLDCHCFPASILSEMQFIIFFFSWNKLPFLSLLFLFIITLLFLGLENFSHLLFILSVFCTVENH